MTSGLTTNREVDLKITVGLKRIAVEMGIQKAKEIAKDPYQYLMIIGAFKEVLTEEGKEMMDTYLTQEVK